MKSKLIMLAQLQAALLLCTSSLPAADLTMVAPDSLRLRFAMCKLESALQGQPHTLKPAPNQATEQNAEIVIAVDPANHVAEGVMSPLELAAKLKQDSATALELVATLRAGGIVSPTLDSELTDIEAWCVYGNYFAGKLRGGVAMAAARAKGDAKQQATAVAELEKALAHWKRLAELGGKFNQLPVLSNSKQPFSWASLTPAVEKDIEIAKAPLGLTNASSTSPGSESN